MIETRTLEPVITMKNLITPNVPTPENDSTDSGNSSDDSITANHLEVPKPILRKDNPSYEDLTNKRLSRGISRATDNVNLVSKARSELTQGIWSQDSPQPNFETPVYTFTLPDLSIYSQDFREFLERDLIETSTLVSLETAGWLNWWEEKGACQRLWPLATSGDGNCLLHAASLGIWGFHDRLLTLRKALHSLIIKSGSSQAFYRRWRWQTSLQNKQAGLVYNEEEWKQEWESILKMASTEPRMFPHHRAASGGRSPLASVPEEQVDVYESLEEVHVLALAHVLRRPIIVIADTVLKDSTGEPFAPIPFGGIYLPLECPPSDCHRSPLCLTYDAAHFSALVPMDNEGYMDKAPLPPAAIPLIGPDSALLPIQFGVDPGLEVRWETEEFNSGSIARLTLNDQDKLELLTQYLDVRELHLPIPLDVIPPRAPTPVLSAAFESSPAEDEAAQLRSKTVKQFHSVVKHFGSIGRSMSKRIKKNLGSIAKRANSFKIDHNKSFHKKKSTTPIPEESSNNSVPLEPPPPPNPVEFVCKPGLLICALLHTEKRHEYQHDMIRNYLNSSRSRFLREKESRQKTKVVVVSSSGTSQLEGNNPAQCVSPGCTTLGSSSTSYLCSTCYNKQKKQEEMMEALNSSSAPTTITESTEEPPKPEMGCSSATESNVC